MCVRAQKYHQNHTYYLVLSICTGFLGGSVVKNLLASAGDSGSVPGLGRSPGEEHGNPLKCSCLGNRTDLLAGCSKWGSKESDTTWWLHNSKETHMYDVQLWVASSPRFQEHRTLNWGFFRGLPWWSSGDSSALPAQGVWVPSLVGELGSHMQRGQK